MYMVLSTEAITASVESTWCFYDIASGSCVAQVSDTTNSDGHTSVAFHPDGLILGTGTYGAVVKIWDVKRQVVTFLAATEHMATQFPGAFSGYSLQVLESHQASKLDISVTAKAVISCFQKLGVSFDLDEANVGRFDGHIGAVNAISF